MSRWVWRLIGILLLLTFMTMFAQMQRKLEALRDAQPTTIRP